MCECHPFVWAVYDNSAKFNKIITVPSSPELGAPAVVAVEVAVADDVAVEADWQVCLLRPD